MKRQWKLGRFAGIDVYIHATFLLIVALVAWTLGARCGAGGGWHPVRSGDHGPSYTRLHNVGLLAIVQEFATDFHPPQKAGALASSGTARKTDDMLSATRYHSPV